VEDPGAAFVPDDTLAVSMALRLAGTFSVLDALASGYGFDYAITPSIVYVYSPQDRPNAVFAGSSDDALKAVLNGKKIWSNQIQRSPTYDSDQCPAPLRKGWNTLLCVVDQVWGGRQESWLPAVDVFDRKDAVVLKAELAGMDPDDIEIEVEDNVLTIKGERTFEEKVDDERYYRVERRFGSFQRSLALPQGVKAGEIQAGYEDGILTVTVPKAEEEKAQRIEALLCFPIVACRRDLLQGLGDLIG
jgi:HSP20 family protein